MQPTPLTTAAPTVTLTAATQHQSSMDVDLKDIKSAQQRLESKVDAMAQYFGVKTVHAGGAVVDQPKRTN